MSNRHCSATDVVVVPATDRLRTDTSWLTSRHCFSFGDNYDPDNTHHGTLLVSNDDIVAPQSGFDTHPHRDMEIVTWVLEGSLVHQDSMGHSGVIYPGLAQRMSAGTGVLHSERNDSYGDVTGHRSTRFIQMWVLPDEPGVTPSYEQREVGADIGHGCWVPIASGDPRRGGDAAIRLGSSSSTLCVARLHSGQSVQIPDAPYTHSFLVSGAANLEGQSPTGLGSGDAVRMRGGARRLTATADDTEILMWEMHRTIGG